MQIIKKLYRTALLLTVLFHFPVFSAEKEVVIDVQKVSSGIFMLTGQGGNIGLSVGEDGVFMIDDQFAPLSEKIIKAIRTVSDKPIKFLINTHWHGDHVGGNQNLAQQQNTIIIAQKNVRKRMSSEQFIELFNKKIKPSEASALPVITFTSEIEFHINQDTAQVAHMPHGHTDGDAIIWFKNSNVIHMGDLFFAGNFPFIDLSSGGSVAGVIDAADWVLKNAKSDTLIIPGHGKLSNMDDMRAYRDMLVEARKRVKAAIDKGDNLDQIKDNKVLESLAKKWGNGFIKQPVFIEIIFKSLTSAS